MQLGGWKVVLFLAFTLSQHRVEQFIIWWLPCNCSFISFVRPSNTSEVRCFKLFSGRFNTWRCIIPLNAPGAMLVRLFLESESSFRFVRCSNIFTVTTLMTFRWINSFSNSPRPLKAWGSILEILLVYRRRSFKFARGLNISVVKLTRWLSSMESRSRFPNPWNAWGSSVNISLPGKGW